MQTKGKRGRPPKYPWKEWFKRGSSVNLKQGKDFDGYTRGFVGTIYKAATRHRVTVRVEQVSNTQLLVTRV